MNQVKLTWQQTLRMAGYDPTINPSDWSAKRGPGKFEALCAFGFYTYSLSEDGDVFDASEIITAEEREFFGLNDDDEWIRLFEDEQGFITAEYYAGEPAEFDPDTEVSDTEDVPGWIESDITWGDVLAIRQGGCASGAYMPAATYHQAAATMADFGDLVLEHLEECLGEIPQPPADSSWSGMACFYLSLAVETWAHGLELPDGCEDW